MAETYADFTAQKAYEAACFFFFHRIYSTEDSSERDAAFRKVHRLVKKWLGGDVVRSMDKLIELQELTMVLDQTVLDRLAAAAAPTSFDLPAYERAYREADNFDDRIRQIELLNYTIRTIHRVSHRFGIGLVLKGLHAGCVLAGDTRLVDFLMDGYKAFANLPRIEPLIEAVVFRETERLRRIYDKAFVETW